jgi:heme exporter protein A
MSAPASRMRLSATGLACVRSGREVFAGVDFTVAAGEALLVVGRNGAGKSSLLRMLAGLIRVAAGELTLDGGEPELSIAEQAHYVGHLDGLKPALTVEENIAFWSRYLAAPTSAHGVPKGAQDGPSEAPGAATGGPGSTASETALDALALRHLAGLPAAYLSAGQKRRLALARIVAVTRPIWLLDEPTSALDAATQGRLAGLMRSHLAAGGIILAATHAPIGLESATELRLGEAA